VQEVLLLERDGVVEVELRSPFEHLWDSILGEVPREGTQNVGKYEGNIVGQGFGEDGGQSGECIVGADSDAGDSAIGEDENGIDGVDVPLYLIQQCSSCGPYLAEYHECRPIQAYQGCEPWEECISLVMVVHQVQNAGAYHYAAFAHKFIKSAELSDSGYQNRLAHWYDRGCRSCIDQCCCR
jgi:hypothetical protein